MYTSPADTAPTLSKATLERALQHADMRVLLMVLVHLTGDRRWMAAPFRPKRDVKLIADEDAGLSKTARRDACAAAVALLSADNIKPAIDDPGDALMVEMMRACLGENVPAEYAPMMREEMGFCARQIAWRGRRPETAALSRPIVIVGAGASGIALGANLVKLGIPFIILEKNDEVGGTWLENVYPGCGVDTPNHAYSFSFGCAYPWSRYFAARDEIQDYLTRSAGEAGIRPHIRFRTCVERADWHEATARWRIAVTGPAGHEVIEGAALVSAIGQLSLPSTPRIRSADKFAGVLFHSANWPRNLDLTDKRVAVIGTGASAMQIVPTIADTVAALTIYQRSPQWVRPIPRYRDAIDGGARWLLQHVPYYAAWFRFAMLWRYGDGLLPTLRKDPQWPNPRRSLNRTNDRHREEMTDHIKHELRGRDDLLAKCVPTYPPFGKRILLDNGWYAALKRPHVELVTDGVKRLAATGVLTEDDRLRAADVIVFATGFRVGPMAARLNITGRDGARLTDVWADDDPKAYLGITVPQFPNFFCMQGPNTGLGHGGSAIFQAECQARYITGCLVGMIERNIATIDVKRPVHDAYMARVDAEHDCMIWSHPGMSTYYRNKKGRVFSVMPWRLVDYWAMCRAPSFDDYDMTDVADL